MNFPTNYPQYFFTELENIFTEQVSDIRMSIVLFRLLLEDLLKNGTQNSNMYLQDNAARINVLYQHYALSDALKNRLHDLRKFANAILHEKKITCTEEQAFQAGKILFDTGSFLFPDFKIQESLIKQFSSLPIKALQSGNVTKNTKKEIYAITVTIHHVSEKRENKNGIPFFEVTGDSDLTAFSHHQEIKIIVTDVQDREGKTPYGGYFSEMIPFLEKYQRVIFYHLSRNEEDAPLFFSTQKSFFVIEPDNLINVTDISNAVTIDGRHVPSIDLLKKISVSGGSFAMIVGNLVNEYLDRKIREPNIELAEVVDEIIRGQALSLRSILKSEQKTAEQLRKALLDSISRHEENINQFVKEHEKDFRPTIEPTFYSPRFGLQGRADILMTSRENPDDFRIYELKSGKPPTIPYNNFCHIMQVSCYEMIAKTVLNKNIAFSALFYSVASIQEKPIRQVITFQVTEQNIIRLRNHLAHIYRRLARFDLSPLTELLNIDDQQLGNLYAPFKKRLQNSLENASPEVRSYFESYFCFTAAEHYNSKLGTQNSDQNQKGFANLWQGELLEKKINFSILYGYSICFNHPETDLPQGHFFLEPKDELTSFTQANFRVGDIVVMYPVDTEKGVLTPTKEMILKGYLKEMYENGILISIRNKQVTDDYFVEHTHWAIEHDYMENNYLRMYESIADFLNHPDQRKKKMILGMEKPDFNDENFVATVMLSPKQNLLFQKALNTKDYFLIQGPPGTGKTSTLLRSITHYLYKNTNEKILILAFTNRAVDEISEKLRDFNIPFFRLGQGDDKKEVTLRSLSESNRNFEELLNYFDSVRVMISTVTSFLINRNNLSDIHFNTAIIDEASQLLEPHLAGILVQVGRFILIGDEKQLPAIVTQDSKMYQNVPPPLQKIGFNDLSTSLFERLLRKCQQQGWNDAYGMLTDHFRMHHDIAQFVSSEYYDGTLVCGNVKQQKESIYLFNIHADNALEKILARSRVLFFDVPADKPRSNKQSMEEARFVELLFRHCMECLYHPKNASRTDIPDKAEEAIGIITPFRAQIAMIRKLLPPMMVIGKKRFDDLRRKITIDTVERYQGSERNIILVSLVVNNDYLAKNICSLSSENHRIDRKLNVTLSRAKSHIILCGDAKTLVNVPSYKALIDYCKDKEGYISIKDVLD